MNSSGFDHAFGVAQCVECDECAAVRIHIAEVSVDITSGRKYVDPTRIQRKLEHCTSVTYREGVLLVAVAYGRNSDRELTAPFNDRQAVRGVLRTRAFEFYRYAVRNKETSERTAFYPEDHVDDSEGEHSSSYDHRDLQIDVKEALRSLPEFERKLAAWRFAHNLSRQETASRIQKTERWVRYHEERVKKTLEASLNAYAA